MPETEKENNRNVIYLKDYKPPAFLASDVDLAIELYEQHALVTSKVKYFRNPAAEQKQPLSLNGEKLELLSVKIDGEDLDTSRYSLSKSHLIIHDVPDRFELRVENKIKPRENTELSGLYQSGGIFCTQNEPEGFRRITYFLDRPDVMARYTTRITADKDAYPILLSNGNPVNWGDLEDGRHFFQWEDPFPKPCYLFAMVAGDLGAVKDTFTTCSGREITLKIYASKGNEYRCEYAMESLKKAMKWDEETFGLECDLDMYMIVAVDDFNFGAMENKGLNIFNAQYVLADPKTATDQNFEGILGVVGHEYFHNWTGNRVTCRDWFQITLKEGLTVFRDQEFSSDMTSRPVKRIEDIRLLKEYQFAEDAGPNAHPIRPPFYIQVNNFYTATVYNKGAEVIRMVHTLIGRDLFRKGIDTYFELYDGQAVTTDDFLRAMEKASGRDLSQFRSWYDHAGTPRCRVSGNYEAAEKEFHLTVEQMPPAGAKEAVPPFYFPLNVGLLGSKGQELPVVLKDEDAGDTPEFTKVLIVSKEKETFVFKGVAENPIPSLLRQFSAPVKLDYDYSDSDLKLLLANDKDFYNRYEAGQRLARKACAEMIEAFKAGRALAADEGVIEAFGRLIADESVDAAFRAEAISLPSIAVLTDGMEICDFDAAFAARECLLKAIAEKCRETLLHIYKALHVKGDYSVDPVSIGKRKLKNMILGYLASLDDPALDEIVFGQFSEATNMTDEIAALGVLCQTSSPHREKAVESFYEKWKGDALVINKWFTAQAFSKKPDTLERVIRLEKDPAFDIKNPNKIRALIGAFGQNAIRFHEASGKGYKYLAQKIVQIDEFNPGAAARLAASFRKFRSLDEGRKTLMRGELETIVKRDGLSADVYEIVSKTLQSDKKQL